MGKIAFVFSGQGAQTPGMGKDLYDTLPVTKDIINMLPIHLREIMFNGSSSEISLTENAQPCLFVLNLACAKSLNERGIFADCTAGFSLGEISALAYSGMMSFNEAFDFVCFRAKVMQKCSEQNKGVMFAVLKLSVNEIESICRNIPNCYAVNYNCPGQTVVSCAENSAEKLVNAISEKNGKAVKLSVSGAFHSPFMNEASDKIFSYLADKDLNKSHIPIYSNVTGEVYQNPKELIAKQVKSPVLWQKTIENMILDGVDTFIELGSGKTLSGLIRKINANVKILNVCDVQSLENTVFGV